MVFNKDKEQILTRNLFPEGSTPASTADSSPELSTPPPGEHGDSQDRDTTMESEGSEGSGGNKREYEFNVSNVTGALRVELDALEVHERRFTLAVLASLTEEEFTERLEEAEDQARAARLQPPSPSLPRQPPSSESSTRVAIPVVNSGTNQDKEVGVNGNLQSQHDKEHILSEFSSQQIPQAPGNAASSFAEPTAFTTLQHGHTSLIPGLTAFEKDASGLDGVSTEEAFLWIGYLCLRGGGAQG